MQTSWEGPKTTLYLLENCKGYLRQVLKTRDDILTKLVLNIIIKEKNIGCLLRNTEDVVGYHYKLKSDFRVWVPNLTPFDFPDILFTGHRNKRISMIEEVAYARDYLVNRKLFKYQQVCKSLRSRHRGYKVKAIPLIMGTLELVTSK